MECDLFNVYIEQNNWEKHNKKFFYFANINEEKNDKFPSCDVCKLCFRKLIEINDLKINSYKAIVINFF